MANDSSYSNTYTSCVANPVYTRKIPRCPRCRSRRCQITRIKGDEYDSLNITSTCKRCHHGVTRHLHSLDQPRWHLGVAEFCAKGAA